MEEGGVGPMQQHSEPPSRNKLLCPGRVDSHKEHPSIMVPCPF